MKDMIYERYLEVRNAIDEAARAAGRNPEEITLVAVSKTKPLEDMEALAEKGVKDFGENYPQELKKKAEAIKYPVNLHAIGHLQTNKVRMILPYTCLIHSVDSLHLAETIEKEAARIDKVQEILIEVNAAEEETKFGLSLSDTEALVREIAALPHVRIKGLMTIAPFVENGEDNRPVFRNMHELLLDIKSKNIDNVDMEILSMGMTHDFRTAVEEGATIVRVGTAIFGERIYHQ